MTLRADQVRDIPLRARRLCGLAWSGQFLWFSEADQNRIMAVDPFSGTVARRLDCPDVRTDLATRDGALLQVVGVERAVRTIDPDTGEVLGELPNPRPGHKLCGLEVSRHGRWLGYEDLRLIDLRDDDGLLLDSVPVSGAVAGVTVTDKHLVYADYPAGALTVVDLARRREIASYRVAGNPTGLTWDGGRVWYCDYTGCRLRAVTLPELTG
ncbi:YncE family protein [Micromonospora olivasterospora]|uniref:Glutamine cyclotransferase n=1 Tax=Micromonospora olivasterospora TaxID=1880 RepID=A0A562I374_MICOL|nr:hypothetical protein [Micromonospora olivasterospora]TWH65144.1 hypothetical protein JD77_00079 [Micromonospora olivasterospora]